MCDVLPESLKTICDPDAPAPPIAGAYWVVRGRFMAGPHPGGFSVSHMEADLIRLVDLGITRFLDLTEPGEASDYRDVLGGKARHIRFPIRDFDTPDRRQMVEILDAIDGALARGHALYLHCYAGLGRTGTIVGCYLVRHGLDGTEALRALRELRADSAFGDSASPQTEAQHRMVRTWSER
ncbi:MAG: protein-tyrosine phosphatase family protein [Anaerolineae bacterium]